MARKSARRVAPLPSAARLLQRGSGCLAPAARLPPRHGAAPRHRLLLAPPPWSPRRVFAGQAELAHPQPRQVRASRPASHLGRQPQAHPPACRACERRAHARPARAACAQEAEAAPRCGEGAGWPGPCGEGRNRWGGGRPGRASAETWLARRTQTRWLVAEGTQRPQVEDRVVAWAEILAEGHCRS